MRKKLLIIDDEDSILFAVHDFFTRLGYDVDCAGSAEQAETLIDAIQYGVVLVDLRLGAGEQYQGLQLARRARDRDPGTRVFILTAYGTPQIEAEARRIGIDAFLHKPHPLGNLASMIAELTARSRQLSGPSKETV